MINTNEKSKHHSNDSYLDSRNYIVYQEGVFVGLLNRYCDITISRPTKKSIVTQQYLKINSIKLFGETIQLADFVDQRCKDRLEKDKLSGIKVGSAVRRFTLNKTTEVHHFLMDLLQIFGYFFQTKVIAGKNGSIKVETANSIYSDGKLLFSKPDICLIGKKINVHLYDLVLKEREVELKQNDPVLQKFLCPPVF